MSLRKRFSSFAIIFGGVIASVAPVSASTVTWSVPSSVKVNQVFQAKAVVQGAVDVDTVRLNGSFPADKLQLVSIDTGSVIHSQSPGSFFSNDRGDFSFGAYSFDSILNGNGNVATFTFKALKEGDATVGLNATSRLLAGGSDQGQGFGFATVKIAGVMAAQPQTLPERVPAGKVAIALQSSTHPDPNAWYASRNVTVSWAVKGKTVRSVRVGFDQSPEGPAEKVVPTNSTTTSFTASRDGVWYVHVGMAMSDGTFERADLPVQIDTVAPTKFSVSIDQTEVRTDIPNAVHFGATDNASGISRYDVFVDDVLVTSTAETSIPLRGFAAGAHEVRVQAYDRAGNQAVGLAGFVLLGMGQMPRGEAFHADQQLMFLLLAILLLLIAWKLMVVRRKTKSTGRP